MRELKNLVKPPVILWPGEVIEEGDVERAVESFQPEAPCFGRSLAGVGREHIRQALARC